MAADKWQLAAMYKLAVSNPSFRNVLAASTSPAALQSAIVQNGWAGQFPAAVVPLLSVQQLAAAQGAPDSDEIKQVADGAPIVQGSTDAWALDYVTDQTVRNCVIQAGTTNPAQSKQGDLL